MIAVDTETTGLDWFDGHYPFIATVSDYDSDLVYQLAVHPNDQQTNLQVEAFREHIHSADGLIFHNAPFDIHMLVANGLFTLEELLVKPIHDTAILSRIVLGEGQWTTEFQSGFGLKSLAEHYLDPDAGKPEHAVREAMKSMGLIKKVDQAKLPDGAYYDVWRAYRALMEEYAWKDTRYTYDLFYFLMERATEDHLACYDLERRVQPELIRMEHRGVRVDPGRAKELFAETKPRIEALHAQLMELGGGEWNPGSKTELLDLLAERGIEITERTPKDDEISTAKWVLERYAGDGLIDALLEWRAEEKLMNTYIEPIQDREVVHTSFWQVGAGTGRMSSSRPNLQNIPVRRGTEFRSVFLARPGHKLIVADYSGIEVRVLAYYVNDPTVFQWVESGDFHSRIGEELYGTPDQKMWKADRGKIKNGVFASIYAAGGERIARTIGGGMTKEEGATFKEDIERALGPKYTNPWRKEGGEWFRRYPGQPDGFVQRARKAIRKRGWLRTLDRRILRLDADDAYKGPNWIIQGSSAGIMKEGLVRSAEALRPLDGHLLMVVHDELVAEVPEASAERGLEQMRQAMVSAADLDTSGKLTLDTSGVVCLNYGDAKP